MRSAWGKFEPRLVQYHHLVHHSADVAAVFEALLRQQTLRSRGAAALGRDLRDDEIRCLSALAFLHDIGKLAPEFQVKGWPDGPVLRPRSHLECGWLWLMNPRPEALSGAVAHLASWPGITEWCAALFAHHGQPVARPESGAILGVFSEVACYDWRSEEQVMGRALLNWIPEIARASAPAPEPAFLHFFCGLLNLADWVGSDRCAFPFEAEFREDYWSTAQKRARSRTTEIGLANGPALRAPPSWTLISDHTEPRPAQEAVGGLPVSESLILLESETGSGKTEAALWRFAALRAAGAVEALYFAVPTRAAARQLHRRINDALRRMFDPAPEAVLAIPGQIRAGEVEGQRLPDFTTRWDDNEPRPARWAAEHAARYLAAQVAIGTVDQVALGGVQVKYAHLRGTALSRALLVIDEVHASFAVGRCNTASMAHHEARAAGGIHTISSGASPTRPGTIARGSVGRCPPAISVVTLNRAVHETLNGCPN